MSAPPPASRLSEEQLFHWLRLIRSENVGPRTFRQLVNTFGGAQAALDALPGLLGRSAHGRAIRLAEPDEIAAELERSRAFGLRFLTLADGDYPEPLRQIEAAPPLLVLRGSAEILSRRAVAIVGARNASAAGLVFAERLARGLARENFVVVSGLARGVDFAAHRASLESGTIAVLAGGHARPYPSEHSPLIEEIVAHGGAVVSEMPLEWEPRGRDFPRRNRIVSGLGEGVVVVEAARRSGSLITARFAAEQGREVFAVPGSPLDPRAEGTNDLLRQGATLCAGAEDVTRALAASADARRDLFKETEGESDSEPLWDEAELSSVEEPAARFSHAPASAAPARDSRAPPAFAASGESSGRDAAISQEEASARIVALLGPAPIAVDALIRVAGLPAREVHAILAELELAGRLARHGVNLVSSIAAATNGDSLPPREA